MACKDNKDHTKSAAKAHELWSSHQDAIRHHGNMSLGAFGTDQADLPSIQAQSIDGLNVILDDMSAPNSASDSPLHEDPMGWDSSIDFDNFGISPSVLGKALIAEALSEFLDEGALSDTDDEEREDEVVDEQACMQPTGMSIYTVIQDLCE